MRSPGERHSPEWHPKGPTASSSPSVSRLLSEQKQSRRGGAASVADRRAGFQHLAASDPGVDLSQPTTVPQVPSEPESTEQY